MATDGSDIDIDLASLTHDFDDRDDSDQECHVPKCEADSDEEDLASETDSGEEDLPELIPTTADSSEEEDMAVEEMLGCCASFCLLNIPKGTGVYREY